MGKKRPNGTHITTHDVVIDALLDAGATPQEIEQIVLNPQMSGVIADAQDAHDAYGKGCISVVAGSPSKDEYDAEIMRQEHSYDMGYFAASLDLFADGAITLDEFAEQNPRLAFEKTFCYKWIRCWYERVASIWRNVWNRICVCVLWRSGERQNLY